MRSFSEVSLKNKMLTDKKFTKKSQILLAGANSALDNFPSNPKTTTKPS